MDRLLLQKVVCTLCKSDSFDMIQVANLFDRLLTITKDSSITFGQVLWYSIKNEHSHPFAKYILNRLIEYNNKNNNNKWSLTSIVNYAHTGECITPLHLASSFTNPDLVELLLHLGSDVWRPNIHGQVALHFALKKANKTTNLMSAQMFNVIEMLTQQMVTGSFTGHSHAKVTATNNNNLHVVELFRKFSIIPSIIQTNDHAILMLIIGKCSQSDIRFDYPLYLEYFEYAIQLMASDIVIDYLLEQMCHQKHICERQKSGGNNCNEKNEKISSPVDLALQYNNLHAMLQSIRLGNL